MKSTTCYTHVSHPGHFRILSQVDGRCSIVNSHDEREPGKRYANVLASELRTCGCGRWRWPVKQKVAKH